MLAALRPCTAISASCCGRFATTRCAAAISASDTPLIKTSSSPSATVSRRWPAGLCPLTTVVAPSLVGIVLATNVLIWVMLGGRGTIIGPVVAAVLVNAATPELSASPFPSTGRARWACLRHRRGTPAARPDSRDLGRACARLWPAGQTGFSKSVGLSAGRPVRGRCHRCIRRPLSPGAKPAASMGAAARRPVLDIDGVSKSFGSFHALTDVSLEVRRGELVSIVGPNGAGKTSLVRCISDGQERTAGDVAIDGQPIGHSPPDVIVGLGMGRKFQGASVFDSLTIGECLRIAAAGRADLPRCGGRDAERAAARPRGRGRGEARPRHDVWNRAGARHQPRPAPSAGARHGVVARA